MMVVVVIWVASARDHRMITCGCVKDEKSVRGVRERISL